MIVNETYPYRPFAANAGGAVTSDGGALAGFMCVTAGSLNLYENSAAGTHILETMAVVASTFYPLPCQMAPGKLCWAVLSGGAVGTFFGL